MVRIETPLHPRICKMLEAVPQRGEGRSGLRDEDEAWNVIHHWHWSHSSPVVGSPTGACVMTTSALAVVLDSSVGFLSERKEWVCARRSRRALGSCNLPALYIGRLQVMAAFFLQNLYHTLIASLQSDDGRG